MRMLSIVCKGLRGCAGPSRVRWRTVLGGHAAGVWGELGHLEHAARQGRLHSGGAGASSHDGEVHEPRELGGDYTPEVSATGYAVECCCRSNPHVLCYV